MASPHQHTVAYPVEKVIDATLRALTQLRYKIDSVDRENGIINFKTGMSIWSWGQELSVLVTKTDPHNSVIDIGSRLKFGVADWGEASRLRTKLIGLIDQNLSVAG
ncbi:MAG TPA: hypothetical protein VG651_08880 [Stellaceae bacterium]|nr:hypothetical protein [Stellaceae bacterium]